MYARVVVDTGASSSIDSLTYEVPDDLSGTVGVGSCVLAPLGTRQVVGYVIGTGNQPPDRDTRPIIALLDSPVGFTQDLLDFARWISEEYICPLSRAVAAMLPGVLQSRVQARVELVGQEPQRGPDGLTNSIQPQCMLRFRHTLTLSFG